MKPNLIGTALAAAVIWSAPARAQQPKPVPVLLTDAENTALMSRHSDGTKASTKTYKYHHRVMEMTAPMGRTVRYEVFAMSPDRILVITTMPGMGTSKSGWDGKVGWLESPDAGAELLDSAAIGQLKTIANLKPAAPSAAMVAASASAKAYSLGQEIIDSRPAKAILTVTGTGDSAMTYYDVATGLMAGMRAIRWAGQPIDTSGLMVYGDYKRIDGTMLPMKTMIRMRGHEIVTRIVEYDHKKIDPAKFAPPPAVLRVLKSRR